jgi:hypothetical protein
MVAGFAAIAQDEVIMKQQSSGTYNALSIPPTIRMNYETLYGDPSVVTWEPMTDYWTTSHLGSNNRMIHLYYPTEPWYLVDVPDRDYSYQVALPVMNTYVPESVITAAINKHGNNLYSITKLVGQGGHETYQIGVISNGTLTSHTMDEMGTAAHQ